MPRIYPEVKTAAVEHATEKKDKTPVTVSFLRTLKEIRASSLMYACRTSSEMPGAFRTEPFSPNSGGSPFFASSVAMGLGYGGRAAAASVT